MLFNSFDFLIFFPAVCIIYFLIPLVKLRNLFLLIASYYFYMNWEPSYAILLFACTIITYVSGILIERKRQWKKYLLWIGIVLNLSILFLFKYFNFAAEILSYILTSLHIGLRMPRFTLLLPVGISFFIFQSLGYMIDVYKKKIPAVTDFFDYALFVSFFPQLVAGPIERTSNLIPQFKIKHKVNYNRILIGIYWMFWGYFLKLVLADNCAPYVDAVYNHLEQHTGSSYLLATVLFTFQIYGDFAGYSLIAIGTAKIMGINLMENFRRPYFSSSISEFWRRWHISLSTWLRDYIYIPLGGNQVSKRRHYINLLTTFAISGLWHGAGSNYIIWGLYHGSLVYIDRRVKNKRNIFLHSINIVITFIVIMLGWMIFRVNSMHDFITIGKGVQSVFTKPFWKDIFAILPIIIAIVVIKDLLDEKFFSVERKLQDSFWFSVFFLTALLLLILLIGNLTGASFIYFQF